MNSTHTHLLRNILSSYWCGMHRACKNTSVTPDRSHWMIRSEKQCEESLSMSLLEDSNCSDAARSSSIDIGNSDCENRAKRENWKRVVWKRHGGSWVSHIPLQKIDMKSEAGTSMSVPIDITGNWWVSLLVPVSSVPPAPPALKTLLSLHEKTKAK